jgi:antirestriction protein ArdC/phage/plasmid primase-like uncharacterized protein
MDSDKKPFYETVAEKLIEQLREGTAPWQKPWEPGEAGATLPFNPSTGKRYRGINALHLLSEGRSDPRWLTYKQAAAEGGQVRRNEKGTPIQYWKFSEERVLVDSSGKSVLDGRGQPVKETIQLERPRLFIATVFNAEQIEGLPPLERKVEHGWDPIERAERILKNSGAVLMHDQADQAFYRPITDSIHLPKRSQFPSADRYYATSMHELGHWTGHQNRLGRDLAQPFGSEGYAKEELRAEIASMILGSELGIGHDPKQHAAYVGHWIQVLQDDPLEIFRAAADAEKIRDYVVGLEQQQVQDRFPQADVDEIVGRIDQRLLQLEQQSAEVIDASWTSNELGRATAMLSQVRMGVLAGARVIDLHQVGSEPEYDVEADEYEKDMHRSALGRLTEVFKGLEATGIVVLHEGRDEMADHQVGFVDSNGTLRDWNTAAPLPDDWQGIVKNQGAYWYLSQSDGERSFTMLAARSYEEAQVEAGLLKALAVDIREVLDELEDPFLHISHQGESIEAALHSRGLTTVGSVTGGVPVRFYETAEERFSPIFGVEPGRNGTDSAYQDRARLAEATAKKAYELLRPLGHFLERETEPAQQAMQNQSDTGRAEAWLIGHLERGTIERALDKANLAQLNRIEEKLLEMIPVHELNPFWQKHQLTVDPMVLEEKIHEAIPILAERQVDAQVAAIRLGLAIGQAFGRERAGDAENFDRETYDVLGFALPKDWTGQVKVERFDTEKVDGFTLNKPSEILFRTWGLYCQHSDGSYERVVSTSTQIEAEILAERLSLIDAHSTINEQEKLVKFARVHEERVRRDPNSTDEDLVAAEEARKKAEAAAAAAVKDDIDLQRRIEFVEHDRVQQAVQTQEKTSTELLLINVPYKQKDEVKALGAKWDRQQQSWYIPAGVDSALFAKWAQEGAKPAAGEVPSGPLAEGSQSSPELAEGRQYLAVPYGERAAAKAAGAIWDKAAKSWYAGPKADMARLEQWKPENVPVQQGPAMTPREEFAEALRSVGCVLSGEHPIMDGAKHRITVEGEKFTENSGSGFYVGHLDGHPAGYVKNNKTGADLTWKSKGYTLDPEQKALIAAEAAIKLQQREAELSKQQDQAAKRVAKQVEKLVPVEQPTEYMLAKYIAPQAGVFTDKDGKKTYVPAFDVDGKQWSMQYIQEDGTKRFAKNSRKEGCFHVVGGMDELTNAPALVIGEGYATAAQLKASLGYATVAAFDSGNLAMVAQALHQKFPDKPVVIAGDDDRHLEMIQGANPGRSKAEEAAKLVGGKVLLPIFAPDENSYPAGLDPVTPAKYREHQRRGNVLSDEQLAALARMKQFTDFNDLATKSALGQEAVDGQVRSVVDKLVEKHSQTQTERQQQDHSQDQAQEVVQAEKPKRRRAATVA